jgi:hypothetical protein
LTIRSLLTLGSATIIFSLHACSDRTVATAKLPNDVATVGIQVKGAQRKMKVNEQILLPVSIWNNGVAAIPAEGKPDGSLIVLATYHWFRQNEPTPVVWDGLRTKLPEDIGKGKSIDVQLALKAPVEPGRYTLVIDLVQEGALWFHETGSQTATLAFDIEK